MISRYEIPGGVTQHKEINVMKTLFQIVGLIIAAVAVIVFFGLLFSLPVMWLWNAALVPAIPGLAQIGWLQAWGILVLCGLLFKPSIASNKE